MGFYAYDNKGAVKALDITDVFGAGAELSLVGQTDAAQPRAYYAVVPFVRRAVRLRANAVAGVPVTLQKGEQDISSNKAFTALMTNLSTLIWRTEFALCLSQYGAYWRKLTNGRGLNPTPEWLLPQACWPFISAENGLEYIRYVHPIGVPQAGKVEQIPPDEIVRFWHPNLDRINWPGPPPGLAALADASALSNQMLTISDHYKRGAIRSVLLQMPKTAQPSEREKLVTWWRQQVAGIRNAFRTNVISEEVKPIVIGDGVADMVSDPFTRQARENIAAAFDIPMSMMLSNSANYATAREERISFYTEAIFPALDLILSAANEQWLKPAYGVELVAHPEQTEAMQDAQVQQAEAITNLVGQPVLTVNEGRAWLGLEPMETDVPDDTADEAADYAAMEDEAQQADTQEQDAERITDPERARDPERPRDDERPARPAKALRSDDGRYTLYPGTAVRTAERRQLFDAHAAARRATRARHADERTQARARHIAARTQATDARGRLQLVHLQRAELATLAQRHAAERSMLRSLHAAERDRLRTRHAAQRATEEVEA